MSPRLLQTPLSEKLSASQEELSIINVRGTEWSVSLCTDTCADLDAHFITVLVYVSDVRSLQVSGQHLT